MFSFGLKNKSVNINYVSKAQNIQCSSKKKEGKIMGMGAATVLGNLMYICKQ